MSSKQVAIRFFRVEDLGWIEDVKVWVSGLGMFHVGS